MMRGIDISAGSGVDFNALKAAGYDFVIARAGWGSFKSAEQIDQDFEKNVRGAIEAGLHVGAYWFMYFRSIPEAQENALRFHETLRPFAGIIDMPCYMDYEDDTTRYYNKHSGLIETKDSATAALLASCLQLERLGWYTGYYCNVNYLLNHFHASDLEHFARWLAIWRDDPPDQECGVWQSAGDVTIPQASGKVDIDACYLDYPRAIKINGLNGFKKTEAHVQNFFGVPVQIFSDGTWRYM